MADLIDPVKITGLREFQAGLRKMDTQLPRQLRVMFNDVADIVIGKVRPRLPTRSGRLEGSLKARSGQREAIVQLGSKRVPYAGWIEFGGRVGPRKSVQRPWRPDGRYLFPTVGSQRDEIEKALEAGLVKLVKQVGLG